MRGNPSLGDECGDDDGAETRGDDDDDDSVIVFCIHLAYGGRFLLQKSRLPLFFHLQDADMPEIV